MVSSQRLSSARAAAALLLLLSVTGVAVGAESVSPPGGSCIVKVASGSYGYDPLQKKSPEDWGGLQGFETCGKGKIQSPIDFPIDSKSVILRPLTEGPKPNMTAALFSMSAGSENWALSCVNDRKCGSTVYKGVRYYVMNIHLHTAAEHTLNGQQYPLEAHVVHANWAKTKFVVIATMFEYPAFNDYASVIHRQAREEWGVNPFLKGILDNVKSDITTFAVDIGEITEVTKGTCMYRGSLTTPPCTEAVTFLMQLKTQTVSREQVHLYHLTVGGGLYGNNRPIQALNGRKVTCYVQK